MHILRKLLYGSVAAAVALVVISFFLPRHVHVERAVSIRAPAATVFDLVKGFQRFNEYSPWFEYDPQAKYTFEGPASGVGARMSWSSEQPSVGSGSQEIVRSEPIATVHSKLDFGSEGTATAIWTIEPEDDGSRVTWAFDTDLGMSPIARYMGLTFERFIGPDYERGLAKLKQVAEASAAAPHPDGETGVGTLQ